MKILQAVQVSRPGLWFPTLWIYLVPFNFQMDFWTNLEFWIGLLFVTFPLNFLVYGLNDVNDIQADAMNPRKGNFLFGAKLGSQELQGVIGRIAWVVGPFFLLFSVWKGWKMLVLLLFMIGINVLYNFKPFRLKEKPPFEIFIQVGYVFVALFSVLLNGLPMIPWQTLVYLCFFAFQAHIAGEIMDLEPDLIAGKKTSATILGRRNAKWLMLFLLLVEVCVLVFWFQDYILAGFLGIFSLWLVLDILMFFKDQPYTLFQMKLFGWAMNFCALGSMLWVLYSGKLMQPTF